MKETLRPQDEYQQRSLQELLEIYVKDYVPDPIAVKLGYVCPVCDGMRITPLYGEKVCLCHVGDKEVEKWRRNRERLALTACSQISYSAGFLCEGCGKLNQLWGQTKETANTCNYCNHKQPPGIK